MWYIATDVPVTPGGEVKVKISPWAFYRFRVILENEVGRSQPSAQSALVESPASGRRGKGGWNGKGKGS